MPEPGHKVCPYCAEEIREAAVICRFCKSPQPGADPSQLPPGAQAPPEPVTEEMSAKERELVEQVNRLRRFVPGKVMERLTEGFGELIEEGERRNITVVFADLCGFTALSETLDPEHLAELMERCYGLMSSVIDKYDGTIDKFIGDCVMALFGAPVAHEDDPERAVRSAIEIREGIRALGREEGLDLDVSVGVNAGEVVVKSFGDEKRADYSALGDAVNLASRLQGKAGRGEIYVSTSVYHRTHSLFEWREIAPFSVKGKAKPVGAFVAERVAVRFAKEVQLAERVAMVEFVGREKELETLLSTWRDTLGGQRRIALIQAEAGVGKSRLTHEFFKAATAESGTKPRSFTGRCLSYGQSMPHLPLIELIRDIAGIEETDDAAQMEERLHAALDRLLSGPGSSLTKGQRTEIGQALEFILGIRQTTSPLMQLDGKERQRILFTSVATLLELLAQEEPTVLVLEDLHWADTASLALIDHLLALGRRDVPLLLLILARPTLTHRFPAEEEFQRIGLSELDDKQSAALLRRLCHLDEIPPVLEEKILSKTEGNPFYVEEIVLELQQRGFLQRRGERWVIAGDLRDLEIPETVQGVVMARLDRLDMQLRRVLQCASVIGHSFRQKVLEQVMQVRELLESALTDLVDVEFLFEVSMLPELLYLFKHVVTQEVTYGTLLRKRRMEFHGRVAEAVEQIYADRLDEHAELLAHHWHLSGDLPKSRQWLWEAGQHCQRLYANEAAIDHYEKLLEVLRKIDLPEEERRAALVATRIELGRVTKITGDHRACEKHHRAALELTAKDDRLRAERALALRNLGDVLRRMGQLPEAQRALAEARDLFGKVGDRAGVRSCHLAEGVVAQSRGDYEAAAKAYDGYLRALKKEEGNLHRQHIGHANMGVIQMLRGQLRSAETHLTRAEELARELGDKRAASTAHLNLSLLALRRGDYEEAKARAAEAYKRARDIGYLHIVLRADLLMSELHNFTGDPEKAIHHCQRIVEAAEEQMHGDVRAGARSNWARALLLRGAAEEALTMAENALAEAAEFDDHTAQIGALTVQADALLALGRAKQALRAARKAVDLVDKHGDEDLAPLAHRTLAEALAATGDARTASTHLRTALAKAEGKGDPRDIAWAQASRAVHLKDAKTRREAKSAASRAAKRLGDQPLLTLLETLS